MPATNDRFFRTDLGIEFYYDGTRWVSTTLYSDVLGDGTARSGTTGAGSYAVAFAGVYDLWLVSMDLTFYVTAGTALDGSNKWVVDAVKQPASATIATWTIDSGASAAWRKADNYAIGALLGTGNNGLYIQVTKTGTPGNIQVMPRLNYRVVAT